MRVRLAWPALQQQDDEGNVGGYRIECAIDVATDGGSYKEVMLEAVDGKTTTRYERSRRIDLPAATSGWQIRVRRLTANQNTNKIADTMLVAGLTEVIDAKLRYPNTALLYIEFDAEQFTNIPAVTVKCKTRKWQVPSNYDPFNRTYSGVWDGSMKLAWTNNAALITYGVYTEDRFGLGNEAAEGVVFGMVMSKSKRMTADKREKLEYVVKGVMCRYRYMHQGGQSANDDPLIKPEAFRSWLVGEFGVRLESCNWDRDRECFVRLSFDCCDDLDRMALSPIDAVIYEMREAA